MNEEKPKLGDYDNWLNDHSDAAALVIRQWLEPVEGSDAVIFPPTYAMPDGRKNEDWSGYNIDRFDDGHSVCQIDSVGSQANRMEPIFKRPLYKHLVPQIHIQSKNGSDTENGGDNFNLLDAGHRAADAVVRFSTLGPELHRAFLAYLNDGNAEPLAKIAPTSIVFGSWDSRSTQAKLPRLIRSVIRAYNVRILHRSAQYSTIAGQILEGGNVEVATSGDKAELGLAHVPAVQTHGGVQVEGEIRREMILNLSALRALGVPSNEESTLKLRRYVLGLALVCFTAPMEPSLREGCELVPARERPSLWSLVKYDGERKTLELTHDQATGFAELAAKAFGVGENRAGDIDPDRISRVLKLSKDKRKELLKGPITEERITEVEKARDKKQSMEPVKA